MVGGLPKFSNQATIYTDCLRGKQHREPISKESNWRASQKLELIHADICGPISPASNSMKRYILCLIDDLIRKTWVYFLLEKSEVLHHIMNFRVMVEKEMGVPIKFQCTDRVGEFNFVEFDHYCKKNGIKRKLTTFYNP